MKYVYASRTGNVETLIGELGLDALRIETGSEKVDEPFILFTYTDGFGDTPAEVDAFLDENGKYLKGTIVSGSHDYDPEFCGCAPKIEEKTGAPTLYKVENSGEPADIDAIKAILAKF